MSYTGGNPPIPGVITGFGTIDLSPGNTTELLAPSHFSLSDLRARIDCIRQTFDPDFLDNLIVQVLSHIQNHNNPHQVTLGETGADVIGLVYQAWLAAGNTGTRSQFLAIFFQVLPPMASSGDLASGTSPNLVSVANVTSVIAAHNSDPNAHADLLATIIPGSPPAADPSYALDAAWLPASGVAMAYNSNLSVINQSGLLSTVSANTTVVDYANGYPAFPLFATRTNLIFPSSPVSNGAAVAVGGSLANAPNGSLLAGLDGASCKLVTETATNAIHGYQIPINMTAGVEYTTSLFVYPLKATGGITLYLDNHPTMAMIVDIATHTVSFTNASVVGRCQVLASGWLRIGLQYVAPSTASAHLMVIGTTTSVLGAPMPYLGTAGAALFGLFGLQHVVGAGLSPYIPTTSAVASHDNITLTATMNPRNTTTGIISFTMIQPSAFLSMMRILLVFSPELMLYTTNGQVVASTVNQDGSTSTLSSVMLFDHRVSAAFSYAASSLKIGTTSETKVAITGETMVLPSGAITAQFGASAGGRGFAGAYFEGWLQSMALYPIADTNEEIEFLVNQVSDV